MPPPSVNPPTPVCDTLPAVVANPKGWVARSTAPSIAPPWTRARCVTGSTVTPASPVRSIMSPPCGTARPATLWPPQRTPISRPRSRAVWIAAMTSFTEAHLTISAGLWSIIPFQTDRAES